MMKRYLFPVLLALAALVSCSKEDNDPRLVIMTFDGLRWQELFSGADEGLVTDTRFVKDPEALKAAYWRETPEERREVLLPFLWSYGAQHGYLIGNREKNSLMRVANTMNFSYPGYSEMFCGWPDDARINSNDPNPNPNVSVLEVVNQDPRYKGKVMMLSSWESIRYAVNNDRGGFPGSSAHEPLYVDTPMSAMIQEMDPIRRSCMWDSATPTSSPMPVRTTVIWKVLTGRTVSSATLWKLVRPIPSTRERPPIS